MSYVTSDLRCGTTAMSEAIPSPCLANTFTTENSTSWYDDPLAIHDDFLGNQRIFSISKGESTHRVIASAHHLVAARLASSSSLPDLVINKWI